MLQPARGAYVTALRLHLHILIQVVRLLSPLMKQRVEAGMLQWKAARKGQRGENQIGRETVETPGDGNLERANLTSRVSAHMFVAPCDNKEADATKPEIWTSSRSASLDSDGASCLRIFESFPPPHIRVSPDASGTRTASPRCASARPPPRDASLAEEDIPLSLGGDDFECLCHHRLD